MTQPSTDAQYIAVLEGIVAVVAIKAGLNPNSMMQQALKDISASAGMETLATQRIIDERWTGRSLTTSALASKLLEITPTTGAAIEPPIQPETSEPVPMSSRLQGYKERQSLAGSATAPTEPTEHVVTQ